MLFRLRPYSCNLVTLSPPRSSLTLNSPWPCGGDSCLFGPMCLLFLNWCGEWLNWSRATFVLHGDPEVSWVSWWSIRSCHKIMFWPRHEPGLDPAVYQGDTSTFLIRDNFNSSQLNWNHRSVGPKSSMLLGTPWHALVDTRVRVQKRWLLFSPNRCKGSFLDLGQVTVWKLTLLPGHRAAEFIYMHPQHLAAVTLQKSAFTLLLHQWERVVYHSLDRQVGNAPLIANEHQYVHTRSVCTDGLAGHPLAVISHAEEQCLAQAAPNLTMQAQGCSAPVAAWDMMRFPQPTLWTPSKCTCVGPLQTLWHRARTRKGAASAHLCPCSWN